MGVVEVGIRLYNFGVGRRRNKFLEEDACGYCNVVSATQGWILSVRIDIAGRNFHKRSRKQKCDSYLSLTDADWRNRHYHAANRCHQYSIDFDDMLHHGRKYFECTMRNGYQGNRGRGSWNCHREFFRIIRYVAVSRMRSASWSPVRNPKIHLLWKQHVSFTAFLLC